MNEVLPEATLMGDDEQTLSNLGYVQELLRRMSGFSNFAISLSIICIVAGGITSFPLALCSVGGASIGIGWPVGCLISYCFALTLAQISSAFPTAGGLYHWAAILGGRGWGWATAWFNLIGLITVLAAINVGTFNFVVGSFGPVLGYAPEHLSPWMQFLAPVLGVSAITLSQAWVNHRGIRLTTRLTDFSGYLILVIACLLTVALFLYTKTFDFSRLWHFENFSGKLGGNVWPEHSNFLWIFMLGLLLPAYTVTGFDASAHTAEETVHASHNVPRGILKSVWVSGVFGWVMLCMVILAIPDLKQAAAQGFNSFYFAMDQVLPHGLKLSLYVGIALAQYLCGLATTTSASRMLFAFARDGGVPMSRYVRRVSTVYRTPAIAIWSVAVATIAFAVYTPVYSTITGVCVIFLYISYAIPAYLGLRAYGKTWTKMGVWDNGSKFKLFAGISLVGGVLLLLASVQPPNDKALWLTLGIMATTAAVWQLFERKTFKGPPKTVLKTPLTEQKTLK